MNMNMNMDFNLYLKSRVNKLTNWNAKQKERSNGKATTDKFEGNHEVIK